MEEKYKQVTEIIADLVSTNPYITKEQVAKAKSMYNGDERPIEVIQAELEAYSDQIVEQGKKREEEKGRKIPQEDIKPFEMPKEPEVQSEKSSIFETSSSEETIPTEQEIYEPLVTELPGDDKRRELQSMIDDALGNSVDYTNTPSYEESNIQNKDQAKVLVKIIEQPQNSEGSLDSSHDGGYGNVTAILTLTIILSIVTMIMAIFTIIS